MNETRQKIELKIRVAAIADELRALVKTPGKLHAKTVVAAAARQLMELDELVERLPEE
jgi:hypothetical protein